MLNYKKTRLLNLLIILSIACIITTSCQLNVSKKTASNSSKNTDSVSPSPLPSPSSSPSQSQTDKTKISPEDVDGKLKLYKNAQYGFSFKYREKWRLKENPDDNSVVNVAQPFTNSDDISFTFFSVSKPTKTPYTDPGLVAEKYIDAQIKLVPSAVVITTEGIKLSKTSARKFVYIHTLTGQKMKSILVLAIKNGYLYVTSFDSNERNYDKTKVYADEIYSSFAFDD